MCNSMSSDWPWLAIVPMWRLQCTQLADVWQPWLDVLPMCRLQCAQLADVWWLAKDVPAPHPVHWAGQLARGLLCVSTLGRTAGTCPTLREYTGQDSWHVAYFEWVHWAGQPESYVLRVSFQVDQFGRPSTPDPLNFDAIFQECCHIHRTNVGEILVGYMKTKKFCSSQWEGVELSLSCTLHARSASTVLYCTLHTRSAWTVYYISHYMQDLHEQCIIYHTTSKICMNSVFFSYMMW